MNILIKIANNCREAAFLIEKKQTGSIKIVFPLSLPCVRVHWVYLRFRLIIRSLKTGIAIGCKTYSSPTTSDQDWLFIPSVKTGPGDSARSHSSDEYIFLEEIKNGINLYIKLLGTLPLMLNNNPNKYRNEIKYINN